MVEAAVPGCPAGAGWFAAGWAHATPAAAAVNANRLMKLRTITLLEGLLPDNDGVSRSFLCLSDRSRDLGKSGDYKAGVLKVNIPRSDLKVTVDGIGRRTRGFVELREDHWMKSLMT